MPEMTCNSEQQTTHFDPGDSASRSISVAVPRVFARLLTASLGKDPVPCAQRQILSDCQAAGAPFSLHKNTDLTLAAAVFALRATQANVLSGPLATRCISPAMLMLRWFVRDKFFSVGRYDEDEQHIDDLALAILYKLATAHDFVISPTPNLPQFWNAHLRRGAPVSKKSGDGDKKKLSRAARLAHEEGFIRAALGMERQPVISPSSISEMTSMDAPAHAGADLDDPSAAALLDVLDTCSPEDTEVEVSLAVIDAVSVKTGLTLQQVRDLLEHVPPPLRIGAIAAAASLNPDPASRCSGVRCRMVQDSLRCSSDIKAALDDGDDFAATVPLSRLQDLAVVAIDAEDHLAEKLSAPVLLQAVKNLYAETPEDNFCTTIPAFVSLLVYSHAHSN